ncbi:MAG TPA: hypothetical protein VLN58_15855, partial [Verrucomicrobiae bacterium]|nr:hypothetical protein [Verrucomicrobiae bacterium]
MKDKNLEQKQGSAAQEEEIKAGQDGSRKTETATTIEAPPEAPPGQKERRFRDTNLPAHFIERRKHPRIQKEPPPPPAPPRLDDYGPIIGKPELDEIRFLARHLQGKTVKMVNSTAVGGGVA